MSNVADLLEAEVDDAPEDENPNMITISKVQLINVLESPILMKMKPDYVIRSRGGIIVGTTDNLVSHCHCGTAVPTLATAEPNHTATVTAHVTTIIVSLVSLAIVVSFE